MSRKSLKLEEMGPRLLLEVSIAVLLLTAVLARADGPYGTPLSAPKPQAPPVPLSTPNATSTTTPTSTPTQTETTNRSPNSIDSNNTYRSGGGGAFNLQGTPPGKEPVIDGKAIPKTIEFTAGGSEQSTKPEPQATAAPPPQRKKGGRGKGKRSKNGVEKAMEFDQEDDGFTN